MRTFFVLSFLSAMILAAAAIGIEFASVDPTLSNQLQSARSLVWAIGRAGWEFVRPLFQLIIVFFVLDWLATRLGLRLKLEHLRGNWTVQTFIAGIIVTTFCIAVLADIKAVGYLKDVVLIVIGFYFGTRAKFEREEEFEPLTPREPPYESTNPFAGEGSPGSTKEKT